MSDSGADQFAQLTRELNAEPAMDAVLRWMVTAAVQIVPGAEHAGTTLLSRRAVSTHTATDDFVRELDQAQYDTGQGPCLSAATEQDVVRVDDLRSDPRWPAFSTRIRDVDVRSVLSFKLFALNEFIGALNLYAATPAAFTEESEHAGQLLVAPAAFAAAAVRKLEGLTVALQSRDVIGQAKGILMERYKINHVQAFDLLIAASQQTHTKLREIADHLATTGELRF